MRCTAVPLYRCTAVPLYRCTTVPPYHCTAVPQRLAEDFAYSNILDKAEEVFGPYLQEPDGQLLLNLLNSLKEVKKGIFGSELSPD